MPVSDGQVFDWDKHLGDACNVVVGHTKKDDKTYDNIVRLQAIPEKYRAVVPANTMPVASGDGDDVKSHFYGLVKFVYDRQVYETEARADAQTSGAGGGMVDDFEDDIPF